MSIETQQSNSFQTIRILFKELLGFYFQPTSINIFSALVDHAPRFMQLFFCENRNEGNVMQHGTEVIYAAFQISAIFTRESLCSIFHAGAYGHTKCGECVSPC